MKTAIDKNESELDKMKRESLEWLERYGKTAPPFISIAVNAFNSPPEPEAEDKSALEVLKNNMSDTTWEYLNDFKQPIEDAENTLISWIVDAMQEYASQLTPKPKGEDETSELYRKLEEGRQYLMSVQADEVTVEDALEAFGWGRNGLKRQVN